MEKLQAVDGDMEYEPVNSPSANAINFECRKLHLKQSKDGFVLSVLIHPNDLPEEVIMSPLMSQYMVAMVRMADNSEPQENKTKTEEERAVTSAAMLCENERFRNWLEAKGVVVDNSKEETIDYVRRFCGIRSRSDLKSNAGARELFKSLKADFETAVRSGRA